MALALARGYAMVCHRLALVFFCQMISKSIDPEKMPFSTKRIDIFLISPQKHVLWVCIRSASAKHNQPVLKVALSINHNFRR